MGQRGTTRDSRAWSLVDTLSNALIAVVLAPCCASCELPLERPTAGPVCRACLASVDLLRPPLCPQCGDERASWRQLDDSMATCPRCRRFQTAIALSRSAAVYDGALRRTIHAFKYDGRRSLARPLGRLLADAATDILSGASCAVPVPLHPLRRLGRGFNQAHELARALPLPTVSALRRTRATSPQEHLTAVARRQNVRDAFALSRVLTPRTRHHLIDGRVVVLIDDVRTTGSTLEQCARVLLAAGAAEVRALTVAMARVHEHCPDGPERRASGLQQ